MQRAKHIFKDGDGGGPRREEDSKNNRYSTKDRFNKHPG